MRPLEREEAPASPIPLQLKSKECRVEFALRPLVSREEAPALPILLPLKGPWKEKKLRRRQYNCYTNSNESGKSLL